MGVMFCDGEQMQIPLFCSQRVCMFASCNRVHSEHHHAHPPNHTQLSLTMLWTSHGAALCSMIVPLDSKSSGAVMASSSTQADLGAAPHGCFCCEAHLALCIYTVPQHWRHQQSWHRGSSCVLQLSQ